MSNFEFIELHPSEAANWDLLIAEFPDATIFHSRAWLNYLSLSRGLGIKFWALNDGNHRVGYFCGGILQRGPFRVLGSPLRGWGTNVMGPIIGASVPDPDLLQSLDLLAQRSRFAMFELEHRGIASDVFANSGFRAEESTTYIVNLRADNPEEMLKLMTKARRYGIRKAIKNGLSVEDTSDSTFPDEFYDQFVEVMRRQGQVPGYSRNCPRLLFENLKKDGRLLALRVRSPQGQVIATGLFPYDKHTLFYWGGASTAEGRRLFANDLLHWEAMCRGAALGVPVYDLSGYGKFKKEFGGNLVTTKRWHKCYWYSADLARRGYAMYLKGSSRFRTWISGVKSRVQPKREYGDAEAVAGN